MHIRDMRCAHREGIQREHLPETGPVILPEQIMKLFEESGATVAEQYASLHIAAALIGLNRLVLLSLGHKSVVDVLKMFVDLCQLSGNVLDGKHNLASNLIVH